MALKYAREALARFMKPGVAQQNDRYGYAPEQDGRLPWAGQPKMDAVGKRGMMVTIAGHLLHLVLH